MCIIWKLKWCFARFLIFFEAHFSFLLLKPVVIFLNTFLFFIYCQHHIHLTILSQSSSRMVLARTTRLLVNSGTNVCCCVDLSSVSVHRARGWTSVSISQLLLAGPPPAARSPRTPPRYLHTLLHPTALWNATKKLLLFHPRATEKVSAKDSLICNVCFEIGWSWVIDLERMRVSVGGIYLLMLMQFLVCADLMLHV